MEISLIMSIYFTLSNTINSELLLSYTNLSPSISIFFDGIFALPLVA